MMKMCVHVGRQYNINRLNCQLQKPGALMNGIVLAIQSAYIQRLRRLYDLTFLNDLRPPPWVMPM